MLFMVALADEDALGELFRPARWCTADWWALLPRPNVLAWSLDPLPPPLPPPQLVDGSCCEDICACSRGDTDDVDEADAVEATPATVDCLSWYWLARCAEIVRPRADDELFEAVVNWTGGVLALGVCVRLLREVADGLTERRLMQVVVSLVAGDGCGDMLFWRWCKWLRWWWCRWCCGVRLCWGGWCWSSWYVWAGGWCWCGCCCCWTCGDWIAARSCWMLFEAKLEFTMLPPVWKKSFGNQKRGFLLRLVD